MHTRKDDLQTAQTPKFGDEGNSDKRKDSNWAVDLLCRQRSDFQIATVRRTPDA